MFGFIDGTLVKYFVNVVTSHAVFPRRCQTIFRPISRIPFGPYRPTEATERASGDRILACVGRSGIPTAEEQKNRDSERPAKAAGRSSRFKPKASAQRLHQRNGLAVLAGHDG